MTTKAVVDAVSALFLNLPVVVLIDGGSNWLRWAAGLAGADYETSVTADQVDRTSVYLADLLRRLSDSSVCAVVIDLSSRASETVSEEFDLHRPMTNLARHYQWQTGILVEEISVDLMGIRADFVLTTTTTTTTPGFDSSKIGDQAPMKAITLDRDFWLSDSFMEIPGSGLCYGKVPADANPERVLARLAGLRSR
jgi:hypothetical protein